MLGLVRYLYLKIKGKTVIVAGKCHACGTCCKSISIEGPRGWLRSTADLSKIIHDFPEYDRFIVIGRDNQGYLLFRCTMLSAQNHCTCYENRLPICKSFPDPALVFMGGQVPDGCGYTFKTVVPFRKIFNKELKKMYEKNSRT